LETVDTAASASALANDIPQAQTNDDDDAEEEEDLFTSASLIVIQLKDAIDSRRYDDLQTGVAHGQQFLNFNPGLIPEIKDAVQPPRFRPIRDVYFALLMVE
jgi:hypothetical protein